MSTETCCICQEDDLLDNLQKHTCEVYFHTPCLQRWITHFPGEIITVNKIQCPHCKDLINVSQFKQPLKETGRKIFTLKEINDLKKESYHKICKTCFKVFDCGDRECEANLAQMPDRCSTCESKIFKCPKCKLELEHAGGCNAFACCLYGWHGCKGSSCGHGTSKFVKFCGHRWCLDGSLTVAQPYVLQYLCQNPLGNDPTYEHCLREVRRDGMMLQHVPRHLVSPELYLIAVSQNGNALRYVPENLKTDELCSIAVLQNGCALQYVPEPSKTKDLCLIAVRQNECAFSYVPAYLKTYDMIYALISGNGEALQRVPEDFKTYELCLMAVKQNGRALCYVPEALRTPELCLAAVTQYSCSLLYVPPYRKTIKLCMLAVATDSKARAYFPDDLKL